MRNHQKCEQKTEETCSFETALTNLEALVQEMENGEIKLDEMISKYEKGMKYMQICEKQLKEAELKIAKIKIQENTLLKEPFADEG